MLLAVWSGGSAVGGLIYGSLARRPPLERVHLAVAILLALALLPMAAASSFAVMLLLVIPAGHVHRAAAGDPQRADRPRRAAGARTEAYTWPVTAFVGGIAIGAALAGLLVEGPGWRVAFVVAAGCAAVGAVLVFLRRSTFVTPVPA